MVGEGAAQGGAGVEVAAGRQRGLEGRRAEAGAGAVGDRVKLRLFDVSNPGLWIAHCHLAEHLQSGMMFSFNVAHTG